MINNNLVIDTFYQIATILKIELDANVEITDSLNVDYRGRIFESQFGQIKKHSIEINKAVIKDEEELIEVICHELAHIKQMRHCKSHTQLTNDYIKMVNK